MFVKKKVEEDGRGAFLSPIAPPAPKIPLCPAHKAVNAHIAFLDLNFRPITLGITKRSINDVVCTTRSAQVYDPSH